MTTTTLQKTRTAGSAAFCDAYVEANNATSSGEGDPTPAFEAAQAAAPEEISEDVSALIEAAAAAEEEDVPPPEFFDANVAVGEYVEDNCDFETIEVTAREYEFEGLPDEATAGTVLVKFTNDGGEVHESAMFTVNEGEERPLEELLALPEEEVETVVTEVTGSAFALPEGTSTPPTTSSPDAPSPCASFRSASPWTPWNPARSPRAHPTSPKAWSTSSRSRPSSMAELQPSKTPGYAFDPRHLLSQTVLVSGTQRCANLRSRQPPLRPWRYLEPALGDALSVVLCASHWVA